MIRIRSLALGAALGLMAAGAIALFAGYLGVRNTLDVSAQIPYLISGGLGGLLLFAGGRVALEWSFRQQQAEESAALADRLRTVEGDVGRLWALLEAALAAEAGAGLEGPVAPDDGARAAPNGAPRRATRTR